MNKVFVVLFVVVFCVTSSAKDGVILKISRSDEESMNDPQVWADEAAIHFFEVNDLFARTNGGKDVWLSLRGAYKSCLSKDFYEQVDRYMMANLNHDVYNSKGYWWVQQGVLYYTMDESWSCTLERIESKLENAFKYKFSYRIRNNYGESEALEPVILEVRKYPDGARISEVYLKWVDPNGTKLRVFSVFLNRRKA